MNGCVCHCDAGGAKALLKYEYCRWCTTRQTYIGVLALSPQQKFSVRPGLDSEINSALFALGWITLNLLYRILT
jgi:hypothetical protein